jgi:hypothetical protein
MRISDASSASPLYPASANTGERASTEGFPDVLKSLLNNAVPLTPSLLTANLHIHLDLRTETQTAILEEQTEEELSLEEKEIHTELYEQREDEYIEDLIEDQEAMEELIDNWEEQGEKKDITSEKEQAAEELQKEDQLYEFEESPEQLHLHDDAQREKNKEESPRFDIEKKQAAPPLSGVNEVIVERDLTYQEIQMLMETTLQGKNRLKQRVREVLQSLLESLGQGQRFLLDQHRLSGLEAEEWMEITQLFPPRFYGGLVREAMLANGTRGVNQLYLQLNHLQQQMPPTEKDRQFWQQLWEPVLGDWPLIINNWWQHQPLLADTDALKHILEMLQHRNALPVGAIGQTLGLALAYQHHPEALYRLFALTQKWLHFEAMSTEEICFFSEKVYERCYAQDLSDREQVMGYLQQLLKGQSLEENALVQILQGCTQNVLSYLPYRYLPPEMQELQVYVRNDLLGKEEAVLQLLMDADHPRQV